MLFRYSLQRVPLFGSLGGDAPISFGELFPFIAVALLIYFVGAATFVTSHRLEELSEILDFAIEIKTAQSADPVAERTLGATG